MDSGKWYSSSVVQGNKVGRTLGYPTLNLNNPEILYGEKKGVYACLVKINGKEYKGAAYFGPRKVLKETKNVLEIFVFDFEKEVYEETVLFSLKSFVRGVMDFPDFMSLQKQLEKDCRDVLEFFVSASQ